MLKIILCIMVKSLIRKSNQLLSKYQIMFVSSSVMKIIYNDYLIFALDFKINSSRYGNSSRFGFSQFRIEKLSYNLRQLCCSDSPVKICLAVCRCPEELRLVDKQRDNFFHSKFSYQLRYGISISHTNTSILVTVV